MDILAIIIYFATAFFIGFDLGEIVLENKSSSDNFQHGVRMLIGVLTMVLLYQLI